MGVLVLDFFGVSSILLSSFFLFAGVVAFLAAGGAFLGVTLFAGVVAFLAGGGAFLGVTLFAGVVDFSAGGGAF